MTTTATTKRRRRRARRIEVTTPEVRRWLVEVELGPLQKQTMVEGRDEDAAQAAALARLRDSGWPENLGAAVCRIVELRPVGAPPWACC